MSPSTDHRPAYWIDGDQIVSGGLRGPRTITPAEARSLATYYRDEAVAALRDGDRGRAHYAERRGVQIADAIAQLNHR